MGIRSPEEYVAGLRDGRTVFQGGRRVEDVTTHPVLGICVEHGASVFRLAQREDLRDLFVVSEGEGAPYSRYFAFLRSADDLLRRTELIEKTTEGARSVLNIIKAIGSDALFALTVISHHLDRAKATDYSSRVAAYLSRCRAEDLSLAVAQTDVKGDRGKRPHQQEDPDLYVRIVDRREEGIVVRGAKAHTTMGPVADEIIVLPTRAMAQEDADYAVAFAVPAASKGLKLVCRPTTHREQSGFDYPISRYHIETESVTLFDDVLVPWERVFLCGEWEYAGPLAGLFARFHRFTAISYKPPTGDLFIGAAQLIAEANGVGSAGHVRDKITRLITYTEVIRACTKAAALDCERMEPGIAAPNSVFLNVGKHYFASHFHEASRLLQDIAGGLVITQPSEADYLNPEVHGLLAKYLRGVPSVPTERRLRLFNLIKDLTASEFGGYNYVVSLHGEGSLEAQTLTTYRDYDLERCKKLVLEALEGP
ncbi:MAG: 4-hydroxyphenylacetate 3-hydroxylase family protein [Nitrospinota bacterium]